MDARGPEAPGGDTLRDTVSGDPRATSLLGSRVLEGGLGGEMWAAGSGRPAGGAEGWTPQPKGHRNRPRPPPHPHTPHTHPAGPQPAAPPASPLHAWSRQVAMGKPP